MADYAGPTFTLYVVGESPEDALQGPLVWDEHEDAETHARENNVPFVYSVTAMLLSQTVEVVNDLDAAGE